MNASTQRAKGRAHEQILRTEEQKKKNNMLLSTPIQSLRTILDHFEKTENYCRAKRRHKLKTRRPTPYEEQILSDCAKARAILNSSEAPNNLV